MQVKKTESGLMIKTSANLPRAEHHPHCGLDAATNSEKFYGRLA
jgi:hypothetical protein